MSSDSNGEEDEVKCMNDDEESRIKLLADHGSQDMSIRAKNLTRRRHLLTIAVKSILGLLFIAPIIILIQSVFFKTPQTCNSLRVRREWRELPRMQQVDYIIAVNCLHSLPSILGNNANASLYDDFSWTHQANAVRSEYLFPGRTIPHNIVYQHRL